MDYHYEGNGNAALLIKRESPSGPEFFFERGYHTPSGPDFWLLWSAVALTNGYAASDYSAIQMVRISGTGAYQIIWNGTATNTQGTALMQNLNLSNTAIYNQTVITCGNSAANELVHYSEDSIYPYFVLTWQTDASATNSAIVERYSGSTRTHSETVIGSANSGDETVPVCYIPATGSEPAKLLWSTAVFGTRDTATLQDLDFAFNVTNSRERWNQARQGQRIPIDYIYDGTGTAHRLIWRNIPD